MTYIALAADLEAVRDALAAFIKKKMKIKMKKQTL